MGWLYRNGGKHLFDLVLASIGLAFFALPMLWIAWRIYRESGQSPLFRQERIGYAGLEFSIMKYRTMSEIGDISPFCLKLRQTAMDELPQLIHIVKGQMSFVGPRPLIPAELKELNRIPQGHVRFSVKPGLAGLAQLYSTKVPSLEERLQWDLEYIRRCSLWLDMKILLKSVLVSQRAAWELQGPKLTKEKDLSPDQN